MIREAITALLLGLVAETASAECCAPREDDVRMAIEGWMSQYPESQYADIYKNFFQDSFGPGHLLTDMAGARRYLEAELQDPGAMDGPLYEPTGSRGNYVRVNLSLIRDGVIPLEMFFDAFVRSMEGIAFPAPEEWRREWAEIDSVVDDMGLSLPDMEADRKLVAGRLASEDFAVHHSERYNAAYSRHYRIIRSDIFERELLPLINGERR